MEEAKARVEAKGGGSQVEVPRVRQTVITVNPPWRPSPNRVGELSSDAKHLSGRAGGSRAIVGMGYINEAGWSQCPSIP